MNCELVDKIFDVQQHGFERVALELFALQSRDNAVYRAYLDALHVDPASVNDVASIPFMPVSFFKYHDIVTGDFEPEATFESSGTTATGNSRHLVKSVEIYRESFIRCFTQFYGAPDNWCIIGLLPSYLERRHSSLVMMVNDLIERSGNSKSGFYLHEYDRLAEVLKSNESLSQKTLLIGVTFALLDFAEQLQFPLRHTTVMETGGMKGKRKEITREEVHSVLCNAWSLDNVHSEYGMTELLSQAYSYGRGLFRCPPWMKVLLRDEDDPLTLKYPVANDPQSGLINVIDLANIYSCAFLAIDDIGKVYADGSFEVLGRMDSSDVRGCSLMYNM